MPTYTAPPIVEATVELRFAEQLSVSDVKKAFKHRNASYPNSSEQTQHNYHIDLEKKAVDVSSENLVLRGSSENEEDILIISQSGFIVSRNAPYSSWEIFESNIRRDWKEFRKNIGYRKISRIGMRYINRIDIDQFKPNIAAHEEYLNVYPKAPDQFELVGTYEMRIELPYPEEDIKASIRSATVPPLAPGINSFVLDIDVYQTTNIPAKDDEIFEVLMQMRARKNFIFEACISDKLREKFALG